MSQVSVQRKKLLRDTPLADLVDLSVLQKLQDWFAATKGIPIVIRDLEGRPVTRPSCQNPFCGLVMGTAYGELRCRASNRKAVALAAREHRVVKYVCHAALTQFAAPIEVEGVCVGTIVMGDRPEGPLDPRTRRVMVMPHPSGGFIQAGEGMPVLAGSGKVSSGMGCRAFEARPETDVTQVTAKDDAVPDLFGE